jgi:hypothetical protein
MQYEERGERKEDVKKKGGTNPKSEKDRKNV